MKIIRVFAVFLTAFSALLAPNATGQTANSEPGMPLKLPVGSEEEMLDYVISNGYGTLPPAVFSFSLFFRNKYDTNTWWKAGPQLAWDWGPTNHADFIRMVQKGGMEAADAIKESGLYLEGSRVWVIMDVTSNSPDGTERGFRPYNARTGFDTVDQVTPETLAAIRPRFMCALIPVQNLESVRVDVDTPNPCWFDWVKGEVYGTYSDNWPGDHYKSEQNLPGFFTISDWYLKYRTRISPTVAGKKFTYTQAGELLVPAAESMKTPGELNISVTKGSDVTIQSSHDLKSWSTVTNVPWSAGVSSITMPIDDPTAPCKFYTTICR